MSVTFPFKMTNYLQKLNNYFHGIIALPLLAFSFLYLEFDSGKLSPPFGERTYYFESGILFIVSIVWVLYLFRKVKQSIAAIDGHNLSEKLHAYSKVLIRFYLLVTFPGAIAVLLMYLTGELSFSLIYLLELFLLSIKRPHIAGITKDLRLEGEEKEIVMHKKPLTDG